MKKIIVLMFILLSSPAFAIGAVRVNPQSPILTDMPYISKIYEQSCVAGSQKDIVSQYLPFFTADIITDNFKNLYAGKHIALSGNISVFVASGYDFGRTLALTDYDQNLIEDECKTYSINYAAVIVNRPINWYYTIPITATNMAIENPMNDILYNKSKDVLTVTPRLAKWNGCRYMYQVLSLKPQIIVEPSDATLDIMENMLWADYRREVIHFSYPYLLDGAKLGKYMFDNNIDVAKCNE